MGKFRALALALVLSARYLAATAGTDLELWRLDCGRFLDFQLDNMSDVFARSGKIKTLANSCYLIRHDQAYMLWDTGFSPETLKEWNSSGFAKVDMRETLVEQLSRIAVVPKNIAIIGISHFHPDHTGQLTSFPRARLLMGKADFELLSESKSPDIAPWLGDQANSERVVGDKDVFGDGTVVMLSTPGHTIGHHSLLVRLPKSGSVILSGDLWAFSEQLAQPGPYGIAPVTMNRADALASIDRILKAASNLRAKIIIQHEKADVEKLPLFPASVH